MREKKYLIVNEYQPDKELDKIQEIIGIEQFDDTNILIDTDEKLPDVITLKNCVFSLILTMFAVKDDDKFYSQLFLEEALLVENITSIYTFQQLFQFKQDVNMLGISGPFQRFYSLNLCIKT